MALVPYTRFTLDACLNGEGALKHMSPASPCCALIMPQGRSPDIPHSRVRLHRPILNHSLITAVPFMLSCSMWLCAVNWKSLPLIW